MKSGIHPKNFRDVLFVDTSNNTQFLIGSTVDTKEVAVYAKDGKEYPLCKVEISSATHPFYTGKDVVMDTAGRVDRFKQRVAKTAGKASK